MSKVCKRCGSKIGMFGKSKGWEDIYHSEFICGDCWKELGFNNSDDLETYKNKAALYLMKGKSFIEEECKKREWADSHTRTYSYATHGVFHKNEDGKEIQKLLPQLAKADYDSSSFYNSMTNTDIKEYCDEDDKVYIFEGLEFDADLVPCEFDGEPAVKVYLISTGGERSNIGWIAKDSAADVADMINKHDCEFSIEIKGGKYKYLEYDNSDDKYNVCTDSDDGYYGVVTISYLSEEYAE